MSSVSIFLIRKETPQNSISTQEDDTVSIRREDNNLRVTYNDKQNGIKTQASLLLTNTSLGAYIRNLGYLCMVDDEPFRSIQFNFPGFPSFMATPKSLKDTDTQAMLVEIANIVSESWFADHPSKGDMPCDGECECECGTMCKDDSYGFHH
jgi:hypothetical protein